MFSGLHHGRLSLVSLWVSGVPSSTHGTLLTLRCTRCIVINAFFLGIMRIASIYGMCIQWHFYEAAQIWTLKVSLGIW